MTAVETLEASIKLQIPCPDASISGLVSLTCFGRSTEYISARTCLGCGTHRCGGPHRSFWHHAHTLQRAAASVISEPSPTPLPFFVGRAATWLDVIHANLPRLSIPNLHPTTRTHTYDKRRMPPPLPPFLLGRLAALLLVLLVALVAGGASAAVSVPLRFELCGPDNLGIRAIRLNQWPGA